MLAKAALNRKGAACEQISLLACKGGATVAHAPLPDGSTDPDCPQCPAFDPS